MTPPTEPLSEGDLDRLEYALDIATPRPWVADEDEVWPADRETRGRIAVACDADAALIVAAVNALPALLHTLRVERARREVAEAGEASLIEALEQVLAISADRERFVLRGPRGLRSSRAGLPRCPHRRPRPPGGDDEGAT